VQSTKSKMSGKASMGAGVADNLENVTEKASIKAQ
jgi:hypothetical protein